MERIASFQVDHKKLNRGIYVSRLDEINGNYLTTFDIRMKLPNREPVINIAELHTIEHLGATFLRNHPTRKDDIIYFGPMGCRTGLYLILKGKLESKEVVELIKELFEFIISAEDVKNKKPDPEGFIKAMDYFNIIPENTIIFEDSNVGIEAAIKSGANVLKVKKF